MYANPAKSTTTSWTKVGQKKHKNPGKNECFYLAQMWGGWGNKIVKVGLGVRTMSLNVRNVNTDGGLFGKAGMTL